MLIEMRRKQVVFLLLLDLHVFGENTFCTT